MTEPAALLLGSERRVRCKMAAAAIVGAAHLETGESCQDYTAVARTRSACAVALADGAGSARHAKLGARTAVSSVLSMLVGELDQLLLLPHEELASAVVARVQQGLYRQAERQGAELGELASTLLFVASDGARFLCGQVGDGRIARFDPTLCEASPMFEPHKGEFANQTLFVTASNAASQLHLARGSAREVGGFALFSDGSDESLYQRAHGTFAPALLRMVGWLDRHSERRVKQALATNLEKALRQRTHDDVSLALMRIGPHGVSD